MYACGGVVQLYIICYCMQQLLDVVGFVTIHIFTCAHYMQRIKLRNVYN